MSRKRRQQNHQQPQRVVNAEITRSPELLSFLGGALDNKRPDAWTVYGYPPGEVTFSLLKQAYERGGAGNGAVHRLLDKCWQELPRIKKLGSEKEDAWEQGVAKVFEDTSAWAKLRDFDRRNMVGRYSALIYRVADGKALSEPLLGGTLVDIIPLYEDQIEVEKWDSDMESPTYGQPLMFQYKTRTMNGAGPEKGRPSDFIKVHPSRVQIMAEGCVGDIFEEGVPLLRAGYNDLIDIEKIKGGSAESYLKNSARTLVFAYEPNANVQTLATAAGGAPDGAQGQTVREVHEAQTKALNRNQDSSIVIQGGKAETLQTQQSDPKSPFEVAASSFAASVRIPFTILFGQQTGRLASDEDKADMIARCQSRQTNELTPMIKKFVTRMQAVGLLEAGEFEIEWPDLSEPTDEKKLANAKVMSDVNQVTFSGGGVEPIFDAEEIRAAAGYEPRPAGDEFKEDTPTPEEIAAAKLKLSGGKGGSGAPAAPKA
jgi:uncharacterized protein